MFCDLIFPEYLYLYFNTRAIFTFICVAIALKGHSFFFNLDSISFTIAGVSAVWQP